MLERQDGTVIENDADIAKSHNDYFCSVFTRENLDSVPFLPPRILVSPLQTYKQHLNKSHNSC